MDQRPLPTSPPVEVEGHVDAHEENRARDKNSDALLDKRESLVYDVAVGKTRTYLDDLRAAVDASGKSRYRICKEIGLTEGAMSRFMNRTRNLRLSTAERLANFLGYRVIVTLVKRERKGKRT